MYFNSIFIYIELKEGVIKTRFWALKNINGCEDANN